MHSGDIIWLNKLINCTKMVPMPPNFTAANGDVNFEKSPLIFYVNGKKVST